MAWKDRLRNGLKRTRSNLTDSIAQVLVPGRGIGRAEIDRIEEILIGADVGAVASAELLEELGGVSRLGRMDSEQVLTLLKNGIVERLCGCERTLSLRDGAEPTVVLVLGVNGSGKTTTIAKLAARFRGPDSSTRITMAAADTFRAAAIEQLSIWAERVEADLVKHRPGADPSAVVFDALDHASGSQGLLFIDTAGRLQTDHNLMEELKKVERTIEKKLGRKADERLLVLDATTGQNSISQARRFQETIGLTGLVLTKIDGTAKGGVILPIWEELQVPLMYIGVGEQSEDLHEFSIDQFVEALFFQQL